MTITLAWTDADGARTDLSEANGYRVLRDALGLDVAPPKNTVDDYVSGDGAALTRRRRPPRQVVLPLWVRHATRVQTRIHELSAMLQGPGVLEFSDGTNTRRLRDVIYEAGLGGNLGADVASTLWRKVAVSLLALDPWWYGEEQYMALSTSTATGFDSVTAFDAAIPFDGGSVSSVVVDGDAEAFPVFSITGPATTLTVTVDDQMFEIASALASGAVMIVDTRPGSRGPRMSNGVVDWSLLTAASRLFTLPVGTSSVVIGGSGTSAVTNALLTFEPRWLTP